jgi:predicted nucleic acid-binding protein
MSSRKDLIYWDSCIFLSWIKNEYNRPDGEFTGVIECVEKVEKNEIILVTSNNVTQAEVLQAEMSETQKLMFEQLLNRRNVQTLPYNSRIPILVKKIREYYQKKKKIDNKNNLTYPDAEHLATAIHYNVSAFYTFDNGKSSKDRGLLSLNGNVAGYPLIICKPPFEQHRLFFQ